MVTKESLVGILHDVVAIAERVDQNILGVVLYGSWTHNAARPDSDVDLVSIQSTPENCLDNHLTKTVALRLGELELTADFRGLISMDYFGNDKKLGCSRAGSRWIDRDSIFISTDPYVEERIKEFVKPQLKSWSRE